MLGSPVDIAIAAAVILVIFGPKKMPEFGKALGQGIGNFKKALTEAGDEVKHAMNAETEPKTDAKPTVSSDSAPVAAAPAPAKDEAQPPAYLPKAD